MPDSSEVCVTRARERRKHVEELRQEAVDAGCTVIGPILPPTGNSVFDAAPVLHPDDRARGAWDG